MKIRRARVTAFFARSILGVASLFGAALGACASDRTEARSELADAYIVPRADVAEDTTPDPFDVAPQCTSGNYLGLDGPENEAMTPGRPCILCHAEANASTGDNSAPIFGFAGTVYPTGHEPDDCVSQGAKGTIIEIEDVNGKKISVTALESGNFQYGPNDFVLPIKARVIVGDRHREMINPVWDGDCNGCHTQNGHWVDPPPGVVVESDDPPEGRLILP